VKYFIDNSKLLDISPDKKITDTWLKAIRLQLPAGLTKYGSIGKAIYLSKNVKRSMSWVGVKFFAGLFKKS
jgi:hypothetical protein